MKIRVAPTVALSVLFLAGAAAAQTASVGRTAVGPLSYDVQRVQGTRGMGDRQPVCAGPGAAFLIISYTVSNTQGAPQAAGAVPHFVLEDPAGQRLAPDRATAGDLAEFLPERESVGPTLAAGAGMEAVDVFVVARDKLTRPGWKLKMADPAAAAIDLAPTPLSPYAAPTCD
jgi:hypothetical protein